jgi:hypothetical protein
MNGSIRSLWIVFGILAAMLVQTGAASAQFSPRRSYGGYRGGYYESDPVIYPNINQTNAAYQQAASQAKQYQASSSMARSSAWQGINQSLAQQANYRTQTMQAEKDSAKDWWFQQQSMQMAQRKAGSYRPTNLPESDYAGTDEQPAAREIMLWPTLLKDPAFDELRAEIEAPFRRAHAANKALSADDYRGILKSIDAMKKMLKQISSQVLESEYSAVVSYLDELAADANKRLAARSAPKPEAGKEKAPESKK